MQTPRRSGQALRAGDLVLAFDPAVEMVVGDGIETLVNKVIHLLNKAAAKHLARRRVALFGSVVGKFGIFGQDLVI